MGPHVSTILKTCVNFPPPDATPDVFKILHRSWSITPPTPVVQAWQRGGKVEFEKLAWMSMDGSN